MQMVDGKCSGETETWLTWIWSRLRPGRRPDERQVRLGEMLFEDARGRPYRQVEVLASLSVALMALTAIAIQHGLDKPMITDALGAPWWRGYSGGRALQGQ